MKIKIYGTRGSIPTPSQEGFSTERYGGNTTSLLLTSKGKRRFIIDAGTGIRVLGLDFLKENIGTSENSLEADILLTHTHWDHIQGIPFFKPFYNGGNSFKFYSIYPGNKLIQILSTQQDPDRNHTFPIQYANMPSRREHFRIFELPMNEDLKINFTRTSHPQKCIAYSFTEHGRTFVFGGDHEFGIDNEADQGLLNLAMEADVALMDSQYTPEEYASKKGWGHSSYDRIVEFAIRANIKHLYLTHHDPEHNDKFLEEMLEKARHHPTKKNGKLEIDLAKEGLEIQL